MLYDDFEPEQGKVLEQQLASYHPKATLQPMPASKFPDLIYYKAMQSHVPPGDAVGLLAAQVVLK
jgi:hypothetical protein